MDSLMVHEGETQVRHGVGFLLLISVLLAAGLCPSHWERKATGSKERRVARVERVREEHVDHRAPASTAEARITHSGIAPSRGMPLVPRRGGGRGKRRGETGRRGRMSLDTGTSPRMLLEMSWPASSQAGSQTRFAGRWGYPPTWPCRRPFIRPWQGRDIHRGMLGWRVGVIPMLRMGPTRTRSGSSRSSLEMRLKRMRERETGEGWNKEAVCARPSIEQWQPSCILDCLVKISPRVQIEPGGRMLLEGSSSSSSSTMPVNDGAGVLGDMNKCQGVGTGILILILILIIISIITEGTT
jgi:hypothetical protein